MNKQIQEDVGQALRRAAAQGQEEQAAAKTTLVRNVIPNPGSIELIWTDPKTGLWIGGCVIRSINPGAMAIMVQDLAQYTEELGKQAIEMMRRQRFGVPPGAKLPPNPGSPR